MDYNEGMQLTGTAVSTAEALTDNNDFGLLRFASVEEAIKTQRPSQSMRCMDRQAVTEQAQLFLKHFWIISLGSLSLFFENTQTQIRRFA